MLPVEETYGAWPASGEIDLLESRGNNHTYSIGGNDKIVSSLHWGPDADDDAYLQTTNFKVEFWILTYRQIFVANKITRMHCTQNMVINFTPMVSNGLTNICSHTSTPVSCKSTTRPFQRLSGVKVVSHTQQPMEHVS